MNINDFRCMHHGKIIKSLNQNDSILLQSYISHNTTKHNKAILLLHGFASSPAVFKQFISPLNNTYDTVIIPQLFGHNYDLKNFTQSTAIQWYQAAEQYCANLCKSFTHVDIIGLSLGGLLALKLSENYRLNHLYLLSPALFLRLDAKKLLILAKILKDLGFQYMRNNAGNIYKKYCYDIAYQQLPLATIIELLTLIKQFNFIMPKCHVDVFLGQHDKTINIKKITALLQKYHDINIHWLINSAHILPLDNDIQSIITCICKKSLT